MKEMLRNKFVYFTKPYIKRYFLYLFSLFLLGGGVALISQTSFGLAAWDALHFNLSEGLNISLKILYPSISGLLVVIAYLIARKKPNLQMIIPVLISLIFVLFLDSLRAIFPDVSNSFLIYNIIYFAIGIVLIGIALNFIVFCDFPLPAIDQLSYSIANRLKLTFGQGKIIGESIAIILTIITGLTLGVTAKFLNLVISTIFFIVFLSNVIDMLKKPIFRLLNAYPKINLFADDLLESDISKTKVRKTSRAIIEQDGKILVVYLKKDNYYMLPGGQKEKYESFESCLKREVLEETGYLIKGIQEKVIVNEYFMDSSFENHYFTCKLKKIDPNLEKISMTEAEKNSEMEAMWIDKNELIDLLTEHDSEFIYGSQIMYREFIGIINSI